MVTIDLHLTQEPAADQLLSTNPLALLIGMLLDQQIPMERAFAGPHALEERLGFELDATAISQLDPTKLEEAFKVKPAIHRFPGSMAKRVHALCGFLVEEYKGDAANVWETADTGGQLLASLEQLPGFGEQKARIFLALLGKQCGVTPPGWEQAAGDYARPGHRSIADVVDGDSLERVREYKRARKARG